MVLEKLAKLKKLEIIDAGTGRMHLDRPLDPFLDMANLKVLTFCGKLHMVGEAAKHLQVDFTPDASKFLELAAKRIEEGTLKPRGRKLILKY